MSLVRDDDHPHYVTGVLLGAVFVATIAFAVWSSAAARVTIKIGGNVMFDGDQHVMCRIARNEENRGLLIGIENYVSSWVQIDRESGRVTYERWYHHVPCEAGAAFCQLVTADGRLTLVRQTFTVAGCDEGQH